MDGNWGHAVTVRVVGEGAAGELRLLAASLATEPDLRGHTTLTAVGRVPGAMSGGMELLTVALAPGGAGTALAATVFAWLRSRRSNVEIEVKRADGTTVRMKAVDVRQMSPAEVNNQISRLRELVGGNAAEGAGETQRKHRRSGDRGRLVG